MKRGLEKFYNLVNALEDMPGIGKKSALRIAYGMVFGDKFAAMKLAHAIEDALHTIKKCEKCGGLSENEICDICLDESRDGGILCIVESAKDIFVVEESKSYFGRYYVVEGLATLEIERLKTLVNDDAIKEIVFAFTPNLSSESVIIFIEDKLDGLGLNFTKIAQGVPTGVSLENIDLVSVAKAFDHRSRI